MKQLKEFTLDQIKLWKLTNSQLKMQIEIELRNAKQLQAELKEAELLLQKAKEASIPFTNASLKTFELMVGKEATPQSDDALIQALLSLRRQNVQLQGRINQTLEQADKLQKELQKNQGLNSHDKYTRVMTNISHAADIRETWDSDDVVAIDDYVMENGVSYDEAKIAVERANSSYGEAVSEEE